MNARFGGYHLLSARTNFTTVIAGRWAAISDRSLEPEAITPGSHLKTKRG